MSNKYPTDLEKRDLESHVELCALRYSQLENRLGTIEKNVEKLSTSISASSNSMQKVILGATATIVAGMLSTVVTILMKF
jgi:hypothetical protein